MPLFCSAPNICSLARPSNLNTLNIVIDNLNVNKFIRIRPSSLTLKGLKINLRLALDNVPVKPKKH